MLGLEPLNDHCTRQSVSRSSFKVKRWTHNLSNVASHQRADGQRLTLAVEVDSEPRAVSAVGDAVDDVVVSTECLRHRASDCDG